MNCVVAKNTYICINLVKAFILFTDSTNLLENLVNNDVRYALIKYS